MTTELRLWDILDSNFLKNTFYITYGKYVFKGYKMRRDDAIEVIELLEDAIGEYFEILDQDYFIVCEDSDKHYKDVIVHGYGTEEKPYEVILPRLEEGSPITKTFTNKNKFKNYIKNDLKKELVLYKI